MGAPQHRRGHAPRHAGGHQRPLRHPGPQGVETATACGCTAR
jgi:hypothetical protein